MTSAECSNPLEVLIVGTGRCGTGYLAQSFENTGLSCGHEKIFNDVNEEILRRQYRENTRFAESGWPAAPFIGAKWFNKSIKIIHLVRNPMKVIRSFYDLNFFSERFQDRPLNNVVYAHTPISAQTQDRLDSAVDHYFYWNALISERLASVENPSIRLRLEDLVSKDTTGRKRLDDFVGHSLTYPDAAVNDKAGVKRLLKGDTYDEPRARERALYLSKAYGSFGYDIASDWVISDGIDN